LSQVLDHPDRVERLAVLDIVPTGTTWERADARFALGYWSWSLLAQPEPLPERILTVAANAVVDAALRGWGSPANVFPAEVRAAHIDGLRSPAHAHARPPARRSRSRQWWRIRSPLLALWSASGPVGTRTRVVRSRYGGHGPTRFGARPLRRA